MFQDERKGAATQVEHSFERVVVIGYYGAILVHILCLLEDICIWDETF